MRSRVYGAKKKKNDSPAVLFAWMFNGMDKAHYLIAVSSSYLMRRLFPDRFRGHKLSFPSMARLRWRGGRVSFNHPRRCAESSFPQMFSARHPTSAPPKRAKNNNDTSEEEEKEEEGEVGGKTK